jgi:RimJ/RimL family protein N-acetyltransferase
MTALERTARKSHQLGPVPYWTREENQMDFIETERLVLRRFTQQDAADLFEYLHQPVASCFLSLALADIRDAEREALERSTHDNSVAVCLRESGKLIGDLFAEPEDDTFSVGWNFNPGFGGKGYAHEAAAALFTYLFTERTARRLYAYVEDTNTSSLRLCEKLGMRREGVFREFISFRNDDCGAPIYENTMQYALLRSEWLSQRSSPKSTVGLKDQ